MNEYLCFLTRPENVCTMGLILDIAGVILLFKFGLPDEVSKDGTGAILLESVDADEIKKWHHYRFISKIALLLLVIGFALQAISNYL